MTGLFARNRNNGVNPLIPTAPMYLAFWFLGSRISKGLDEGDALINLRLICQL